MTEEQVATAPLKVRKPRATKAEMQSRSAPPSGPAPKTKARQIRKKVWATESFVETQNMADYEPVEFVFWNEEQRGVVVPYEWTDRWIRIGECKGMFYDGQTYTLPKCVYDYYKQLSVPIYENRDQELIPGQMTKASKEVGRKYRFRLEPTKR